jgi:hypothetical protein
MATRLTVWCSALSAALFVAGLSSACADSAPPSPRARNPYLLDVSVQPETRPAKTPQEPASIPPTECRGHGDCDDGNPCTAGFCDFEGRCLFNPLSGYCDDGDICTVDTECVDGECVGTAVPCPSADDPCQEVFCDPGEGCVYRCLDLPECATECERHADCDDGDAGSIARCVRGPCSSRCTFYWPECDDNNPCTEDWRGDDGLCYHRKLHGNPCDDGSACTERNRCFDGVCAGEQVVCQDDNPCTANLCDPAVGCVFHPLTDGVACNDGNACTTNEACLAGRCVGRPRQCPDDGDSCTLEFCDPTVGCTFFCRQIGYCSAHCHADSDCDDGDPCTIDRCAWGPCSQRCEHTPDPCNDGDFCTVGYCDPEIGGCRQVVFCERCETTDDCTEGDACRAVYCSEDGFCEHFSPDCTLSGDPCSEGYCDPESGCAIRCIEDCPERCTEGSDCDDGNPCTVNRCVVGACGLFCKTERRTCVPPTPCTAATCVLGTCVLSVPAATPTLDGVVGDDWHPRALAATGPLGTDFEAPGLGTLRVQVDRDLLHVGIEGLALEEHHAIVAFLDVDYGTGLGVRDLGTLQPRHGPLDSAICGRARFEPLGFAPDFAFGTAGMYSAVGASSLAGWRRFDPRQQLAWLPQGVVLASAAARSLEAAIPLSALLPSGVPREGVAMALVVLLFDGRQGAGYCDVALPGQPQPLDVERPRVTVIHPFQVVPSLYSCCTESADCRDGDPCTRDVCDPNGVCLHLPDDYGACLPD